MKLHPYILTVATLLLANETLADNNFCEKGYKFYTVDNTLLNVKVHNTTNKTIGISLNKGPTMWAAPEASVPYDRQFVTGHYCLNATTNTAYFLSDYTLNNVKPYFEIYIKEEGKSNPTYIGNFYTNPRCTNFNTQEYAPWCKKSEVTIQTIDGTLKPRAYDENGTLVINIYDE